MDLYANLLKKFNKIAVISNFLAFFLFLFEKIFPPGSMRIWIHSPDARQ